MSMTCMDRCGYHEFWVEDTSASPAHTPRPDSRSSMQVAYPKRHTQADISDIYLLATATKGVFVNVALQV